MKAVTPPYISGLLRALAIAVTLPVAACSGSVAGGSSGTKPDDGKGGVGGTSDTGTVPRQVSDLSGDGLAGQCKVAPTLLPGQARLWRLSRVQIRNTLKSSLGVSVTDAHLAAFNDGFGFLYANEADTLRIRKGDASSWALTSDEIAALAVPGVKASKTCADYDKPECATPLLAYLGPRLFRRPLSADESKRYQLLFTGTLTAKADATRAVLSAMLQSPYFLYRSELGDATTAKNGVSRLTPYETASALSFTLWQDAPDAELLAAAASGELKTAAGVTRQAERMVKDTRFTGFYTDMLSDLTLASRMSRREGADNVKDSVSVMRQLSAEFASYVKQNLDTDATLESLLTNRSLVTVADAAKFRNLGTDSGSVTATVSLPAPVAGLFSLGAIGFANAGTDHPSPIKRGVMVREHFLCAPVPPPPDNLDLSLVPRSGTVVTNRDVYERSTSPETCSVCHSLFNPMGFAFESFDEVGRYRTTDNGAPVNLSGSIVGTRDADGPFANLTEMAGRLARSEQVSECFVLNAFRFANGRLEGESELCEVSRIHQAFSDSRGDMRGLAVSLVASEPFLLRTISN